MWFSYISIIYTSYQILVNQSKQFPIVNKACKILDVVKQNKHLKINQDNIVQHSNLWYIYQTYMYMYWYSWQKGKEGSRRSLRTCTSRTACWRLFCKRSYLTDTEFVSFKRIIRISYELMMTSLALQKFENLTGQINFHKAGRLVLKKTVLLCGRVHVRWIWIWSTKVDMVMFFACGIWCSADILSVR